jgi:ankyrin repeat protein
MISFIDIDERDHAGRTPLMWAAAFGQAPTVSLLLRHGADVNAHGQEDETALHLAAARGHHDVARILVSMQWNFCFLIAAAVAAKQVFVKFFPNQNNDYYDYFCVWPVSSCVAIIYG